MRPQTEEAYDLLHQGALALADISENGMRVDTAYLTDTLRSVARDIEGLKADLYGTDFWGQWRRKYGDAANLTSHPQIGDVLYNVMGFSSGGKTATGRHKTDVDALEQVDHPFVKDWVKLQKMSKLHGTYLKGLQREVVGEYVHPFFHLHTVRTYRGSSSDPNFQNLPIRDGEIAELLRKCFIPREGHCIVENDFKGVEVCVAACYNHDPVLIDYIKDPSKDMHRDNAAALFMIDDDTYWKTKEGKDARYVAKNQFTFPGFYGSYYVDITRGLWQAMAEKDLRLFGQPMRDHLAERGINGMGECVRGSREDPLPGSFEAHVRGYEDWYWNTKYTHYTQWKRDWHQAYLREGGFKSLTGFYYEGLFERNQVLNYSIQGSAFHLLLWVLIRLQAWLKKNKMRSRIVGQIHDSIIGDVHEAEKDEYLAKVKELVSTKLPAFWDWIVVPLSVEAEVAPVGGSWWEKKEVKGF